jgi:hypothetical protein
LVLGHGRACKAVSKEEEEEEEEKEILILIPITYRPSSTSSPPDSIPFFYLLNETKAEDAADRWTRGKKGKESKVKGGGFPVATTICMASHDSICLVVSCLCPRLRAARGEERERERESQRESWEMGWTGGSTLPGLARLPLLHLLLPASALRTGTDSIVRCVCRPASSCVDACVCLLACATSVMADPAEERLPPPSNPWPSECSRVVCWARRKSDGG